MNPKMTGVVVSREYATRVKKKSFLVITFVVPILFAAMCCMPALIMMFSKDEGKLIAVVDKSDIVMPVLESTKAVQYADCSNMSIDSLKAQFAELPYSALLYISPIDESKSVTVNTFSVKPVSEGILASLDASITGAVQNYRIEQYDIEGLGEILEEVKPKIDIKSYTISEDGSDKASNTKVYMILSLALGMVIFMFVTMFSSSVMQSVIEEKQSKVVEVLLSSVDSIDLMFGKIIGVALVALTQFLLWIILTVMIVSAVFFFVGTDRLMGEDGQAVVSSMSDPALTGMTEMAGMDAAGAAASSDFGELQEIMQTLSSIDIPQILICFIIFFIFGYLLYASLFAAIGSAVENAEDSNQLQIPLTIPLILAYFIAIYSWNAPDSALAVWGSMIPFTSPIVMLSRIPFGVPSWQIWLSVALLVLTFAAMGWMSAKIYRVGILTSGKKATWKDLWKWVRQK